LLAASVPKVAGGKRPRAQRDLDPDTDKLLKAAGFVQGTGRGGAGREEFVDRTFVRQYLMSPGSKCPRWGNREIVEGLQAVIDAAQAGTKLSRLVLKANALLHKKFVVVLNEVLSAIDLGPSDTRLKGALQHMDWHRKSHDFLPERFAGKHFIEANLVHLVKDNFDVEALKRSDNFMLLVRVVKQGLTAWRPGATLALTDGGELGENYHQYTKFFPEESPRTSLGDSSWDFTKWRSKIAHIQHIQGSMRGVSDALEEQAFALGFADPNWGLKAVGSQVHGGIDTSDNKWVR